MYNFLPRIDRKKKGSIFGRHLLQFRKIGICFGNRLIDYFFHDQTIILKDCELYTIGHFLPVSCIKLHILQTFDQPIGR